MLYCSMQGFSILMSEQKCMPIYTPVLFLLSEALEVTVVLVDDLIIATLGKALGGFEDIFASAAPVKFFLRKNANMKLKSEYRTAQNFLIKKIKQKNRSCIHRHGE
jgi:hypothetical protein